jgi:hypothetical protein
MNSDPKGLALTALRHLTRHVGKLAPGAELSDQVVKLYLGLLEGFEKSGEREKLFEARLRQLEQKVQALSTVKEVRSAFGV